MASLIQVGIVTHPSRLHMLDGLAHLRATVYEDPAPAGPPIAWRGYRNALTSFVDEASATHLCLLQDDVEVVEGFLPAVERAVWAEPRDPIALFVPVTASFLSAQLLEACAADEPFIRCASVAQRWVPVVAVVWPLEQARAFLRWADGNGFPPDRNRADDGIVGEWARGTNVRFLATVPSLVQHPDVEPSLIGGKHGTKRVATCLAWHGDDFQP